MWVPIRVVAGAILSRVQHLRPHGLQAPLSMKYFRPEYWSGLPSVYKCCNSLAFRPLVHHVLCIHRALRYLGGTDLEMGESPFSLPPHFYLLDWISISIFIGERSPGLLLFNYLRSHSVGSRGRLCLGWRMGSRHLINNPDGAWLLKGVKEGKQASFLGRRFRGTCWGIRIPC